MLMGMINPINNCLCTRDREKSIHTRDIKVKFLKFMKMPKDVKKRIFTFMEFEMSAFLVILYNKKLTEEVLQIKKGIINNKDFLNYNIRKKLRNFSLDNFEKKLLSIFSIDKEHSDSDDLVIPIVLNIINDDYVVINIKNDNVEFFNFYLKIIHQLMQIKTNIFTSRNLHFKIVINFNEINSTVNILNSILFDEAYNLDKMKIKIDLIIPEKYCSSSLSLIAYSPEYIIVESLIISKVSLYSYGLDKIEKKVNQKLKFLELKEEGLQDDEGTIYDVINLNATKNLIEMNTKGLVRVVIDTSNYVNIKSDDFYTFLKNCEELKYLEIKSKISKMNIEILKNLLKDTKLKYFDLDLSLIKEEDFLDKILAKNLVDFVFEEKIIIFPFTERLLISQKVNRLGLINHVFEVGKDELVLNFNEILMDFLIENEQTELELEIDEKNNIPENVKLLADLISFCYIKKVKIIHNIVYSEYIKTFITALFAEISERMHNDFQIEEFHLLYESDDLEVVFDGIFDYFLCSESIKVFNIEKIHQKLVNINNTDNTNELSNSINSFNCNKVNIKPYFIFHFTCFTSNKWISFLSKILSNNNLFKYLPNALDLSFTVNNQVFGHNFSEFIHSLSNAQAKYNCFIKKFEFDLKTKFQIGESNYDKLVNYISSQELLQSFYFVSDTLNNKYSTYFDSNYSISSIFYYFNHINSLIIIDRDLKFPLQLYLKCLEIIKPSTLQFLDLSGVAITDNHFETNAELYSKFSLSLQKLKLRTDSLNLLNNLNEFIPSKFPTLRKLIIKTNDTNINIRNNKISAARMNKNKLNYILKLQY